MLYVGMLFFSLAITSGLYAFADIATAPADVAQTMFYACLLLASVSFAVCLGRTQWAGRDSSKASIAGGAGYGAPGMAPAHTTT